MGDPNLGGQTRVKRVTAYRQDALRCAGYLRTHGISKAAAVALGAEVPAAARLMRADHYGWFERVERGVYTLTPKGQAALDEYASTVQELAAAKPG